MLKRREYKVDLTDPHRGLVDDGRVHVKSGEGNLYSSELEGSALHAPALDLDIPCEVYDSTTPGNSHLYIDVPMTWDKYAYLLMALADVGILEQGYVKASLGRRATFLRKPGIVKTEKDVNNS